MGVWRGVMTEHRESLPVTGKTPLLGMAEGGTPLLEAQRLREYLGHKAPRVYLKLEGMNPTGSFKDRGMVVAVAKALEEGSSMIICASTGNTSASAAAYAARAGIKCAVLVPGGHIALGKLAQALSYGAKVLSIQGSFDDALSIVRDLCATYPVTLVNSVNPYRIEGQKTAAFEICDAMGDAPDALLLPVGNAGNITAYWRGFRECRDAGKARSLPRMLGFQAAGASPLVLGRPVPNPETIATAIRIGNPASWDGAIKARDESGGLIDAVTDQEILEAYGLLASLEGIFAEPASAASVAGLVKLNKAGQLDQYSRVVCVLTGHGLKDPGIAMERASQPGEVPAALEAVARALGLGQGGAS